MEGLTSPHWNPILYVMSKTQIDKFNPDKVKELKDVLKGASPRSEGIDAESKGATEELEKLTADVKKKEEEAKEHQEKYLRTLAEFENFRKRMEREKDEMVKYGLQKYVKEMFPVLDHLEMTLAHADEEKKSDPIVEGVRLVVKEFLSVFEKFGLQEIRGEGRPFDPHRQEAIGSVETDETAPGNVATVHRKGFMLHDRVIRPAMVTVAKAPEEEPAGEEDSESTVH